MTIAVRKRKEGGKATIGGTKEELAELLRLAAQGVSMDKNNNVEPYSDDWYELEDYEEFLEDLANRLEFSARKEHYRDDDTQ